MITIYQTADEPSRSADRPCYYDATCTAKGWSFTARARYGACHAVARQLVAAGFPDQPVTVAQAPHGWELRYPSLHRLSLRTIAEGPTTPLRSAHWTDPTEAFARLGGKAELGVISASVAMIDTAGSVAQKKTLIRNGG